MDAMPVNVLLLGKGNTVSAEGLHEQLRAGVRRPQAARGLGLDAGGDRRLPARRRRDRRPGRDPHRHAQRGRLRAVDARRDRRPHDPRVPHRRRGRRPRAGHHRGRRRSRNVLPVLDQPDAPAHRQHRRRAPRHADGLPPPQPADPGGPRVRREPHPRHDDRRRGRPARPRRDLDDRLRLAGDGPRGRDDRAHLADRARDGRRAAAATGNERLRRYVAKYTICPAIAHGIDARGRLGRGRQARRPRAVGPGVLRDPPAAGDQGRRDRLRADGRRQRVDPDARSRC